MDAELQKRIEQKIQETVSNRDEIKELFDSLSDVGDSKSFGLGIIMGRIYNAFYYHCKRLHKREPTKEEFDDFLKFVKSKKSEIESLW